MADSAQGPVSESFVQELRSVLGLLYDWVALRDSRLIGLFGLGKQEDPPLALRKLLADSIEALKPAPQVLLKAKAWRTYQLLFVRYTEQFTQAETATELGLSIRHLRREETAAVQRLAAYLWDHYDLDSRWGKLEALSPHMADGAAPAVSLTPSPQQELGWLEKSLPSEPVDVQHVILAVLELLRPMAQAVGVEIDYSPADKLPLLLAQRTTMRQALLTVCATAVHSAASGRVVIRTRVTGSGVSICVRAATPRPTHAPGDSELERLEIARQIVELSQGSLDFTIREASDEPLSVTLVLPAEDEVPVLVIDDNADTLQLLERYLSNSRYHFIGAPNPQRALALIDEVAPRIIVLDVMLPVIDGWELLGRLRQHPQTCDAPVIVCSILPQEQLAISLGAAGFIRKPVSRAALLSALDQHLGRSQIGSG